MGAVAILWASIEILKYVKMDYDKDKLEIVIDKNNKSIIFNNDAYMIKLLYCPIYFGISNLYTFLHFNY